MAALADGVSVPADADPTAVLADLFRDHPAWRDAAKHVDGGASSAVWFTHRPGEPWRLVRRDGTTFLEPGVADDPDFVFRFTPAAIERLAAVRGGVGDFAVALFRLVVEPTGEARVDFRIRAGFARLVRRGYLRLLLAAGPAVLAFGLAHGVTTVGALRRLVASLRTRPPAPWERGEA